MGRGGRARLWAPHKHTNSQCHRPTSIQQLERWERGRIQRIQARGGRGESGRVLTSLAPLLRQKQRRGDATRRTQNASETATSCMTDARDGELLSRPSGDRAPASHRELARPAVDTHTNEFGDTKCNSLAIDAITTNSSGCVTRRRACEGCDTCHARTQLVSG